MREQHERSEGKTQGSEISRKGKLKLSLVIPEEHNVDEKLKIVVSSLWKGAMRGKKIEDIVKHHRISLTH